MPSDLTHSICTLCSIDAVAETEVQGGKEVKKKKQSHTAAAALSSAKKS